MTDLIQRLAEIREQGGREPLPDPTKIEGGPMPERPPVDLSQIPVPDWDEENDFPEPEPIRAYIETSPLIPRQTLQDGPGTPLAIPQAVIPPDGMFLAWRPGFPCEASFMGRAVTLTDSERARHAKLMVQALKRSLEEQQRELADLLPKRVRRKRLPDKPIGQGPTGPPIVVTNKEEIAAIMNQPKRRGRPRKQRLDGGER